jgi:hypothetical protein
MNFNYPEAVVEAPTMEEANYPLLNICRSWG